MLMRGQRKYCREPATAESIRPPHQIDPQDIRESNILMSFGKNSQDMDMEAQLYELTTAQKMKDVALEKASKMVALLEEERVELRQEIAQLQSELNNKNEEIIELSQKLQTMRFQTGYTPSKMEAITGSKLLFSFSQPTSPTNKAELRQFSPSTVQVKPGVTVSQSLSPWPGPEGILTELAEVISKEESQFNALGQIEDLVSRQNIEEKALKYELRLKSEMVEDELDIDYNEGQSSKIYTSSTQKQQQISLPQIFQGYEQIISNYRSYSCHLKSFLCQVINCLSKVSQSLSLMSNDHQWTLHGIERILQQTAFNLAEMQLEVKGENEELRDIVEGLISEIRVIGRSE